MTLYIHMGRRVPKSWFRRQANRVAGLISFQENIWQMIRQSMQLAKRKANSSGKIIFILEYDKESEDINYEIEWLKITIQGTEEQELEEYEESLQLYNPLINVLKKDFPKDDRLKKYFNSKILNPQKVKEAYEKGYGCMSDNNLANKLLEMGILTHIELVKDYDTRQLFIKPDF